MKKAKALAVWGSGAMLTLSAGVLMGWQTTAGAAPASTGAASANGKGQGGGNSGVGVGNGAGGASTPAKALLVDEAVSGEIVPGAAAVITVTISNPNSQPVILTGITKTALTVTPAAGQACAPENFSFASANGLNRRLEKAGTAQDKDRTTVALQLRLLETGLNQDGCKNAGLAFTYTATANQA